MCFDWEDPHCCRAVSHCADYLGMAATPVAATPVAQARTAGSTEEEATRDSALTNTQLGDAFLAASPYERRRETARETGYDFGRIYRDAGWWDSRTFAEWDFQDYLLHTWHPGAPRGASCADLRRFGNDGDGGKMVCDAREVLSRHADGCLIVSVGSNGDTSFEVAMRALNPACEVHIYEPAMTAGMAKTIPKWAKLYEEPFGPDTADKPEYANRSIAILKIDCEGCEFEAMPTWLTRTCTELVLTEVHGCLNGLTMSVADRMRRFHGLMSATEAAGYKVFSSEVNLLAPSPTCMEYGLKRSTVCPRLEGRAAYAERAVALARRPPPHKRLQQSSKALPPAKSSQVVVPHDEGLNERVLLIANGLVQSLLGAWEKEGRRNGLRPGRSAEAARQVKWQAAIFETMRFAARWGADLAANTTANANAAAPHALDSETLSALALAGIAPEALPSMNPSALCTMVNVPQWAFGLAGRVHAALHADDASGRPTPRYTSAVSGGGTEAARESRAATEATERTLISYFFVRLAWIFRRSCTNFGAVVLQGLTPRRVLFRSQATGSGPLLASLIEHGGLKHVHNVYSERAFPLQDLLSEESRDVLAVNGSFQTHEDLDLWHWLIGGLQPPPHGYKLTAVHNLTAMRIAAGVVNRILNPSGRPPQGNILVHCAGGVHRTGIVVALVRRFVNRDEPLQTILDDFRRHVGGEAASTFVSPSGFEEQKMRFFEEFISSFDLRLLTTPGAGVHVA